MLWSLPLYRLEASQTTCLAQSFLLRSKLDNLRFFLAIVYVLLQEFCILDISRRMALYRSSTPVSFKFTDDDASSEDVAISRKVKGTRRGRAPKEPSSRRLGLAQSRRLQRVLQDSCNLKSGAWPRPPVNYCILIAMALSSSRSGSLNVQQIYNFTRWTKLKLVSWKTGFYQRGNLYYFFSFLPSIHPSFLPSIHISFLPSILPSFNISFHPSLFDPLM